MKEGERRKRKGTNERRKVGGRSASVEKKNPKDRQGGNDGVWVIGKEPHEWKKFQGRKRGC